MFPLFNTRMSMSHLRESTDGLRESTVSLGKSTASLARQHSRLSLVAAGAAAVGVLTAATASAGVAHSAHVVGSAAQTAQVDGAASNASAFDVSSILKAATHNLTSVAPPGATHQAGFQGTLTALHSAATGGSTAPGAAGTPHALLADPAVVPHAAAHQVAKPAAPAAAKPAAPAAKPAVAPKPVAKPQPKPAPPPQPFLMYDSVTPSALPAGQPAAVYANGTYAASPSQVGGHRALLWIDTNGSDPRANVLDVEPGDATPYGAAQWVHAKLSQQPNTVAVVYTMLSDWQQVKANVAALPTWMQSHVQYWIADPTGYPHIVPGSTATQWYWGSSIDESTAAGNFMH